MKFKNYWVTLRNRSRFEIKMLVKHCVSEAAAGRTAELLYRMSRNYQQSDPYWSAMAYEVRR